MAIIINFQKETGEGFLNSLSNGKPITPPRGDSWNANEMLTLAGACFFAAMTHGPAAMGSPSFIGKEYEPGKELEGMHPEHQEAVEETFQDDLHAAIDYYSYLSQHVFDDEYDQLCEPNCIAWVQWDKGEKKMKPLKGFKDHPKQMLDPED